MVVQIQRTTYSCTFCTDIFVVVVSVLLLLLLLLTVLHPSTYVSFFSEAFRDLSTINFIGNQLLVSILNINSRKIYFVVMFCLVFVLGSTYEGPFGALEVNFSEISHIFVFVFCLFAFNRVCLKLLCAFFGLHYHG